MAQKIVYQLSARQILVIALASAFIAVGTVACINNFGGIWQSKNSITVLAEDTPRDISNPSTVSDEQNSIEVYKSLSPGVAFITATSYNQNFWGEVEEGKGSGSGSVIDPEGHILTNYHVIEGAEKLTVSLGGDKVYPAKVIGGDPDTDLAVIQITPPQEGLTILTFGDSDKLTVGQKVLAIGNPFGLDRTLTTGIISGLQRPIRARNDRVIEGAIQTDASINPGNSGGPLLDKFGKMIGINSQILSPAGGSVGVGFAIPVSIARRIVPQLIQFGQVRRPNIGMQFTPYSVAQYVEKGVRLPVENGLVISEATAGGSAQRAGIIGLSQNAYGQVSLGDILLSLDGVAVNNTDDLYRFLDKKQIGDTVQAEIFRNGKKITVAIKLMAPPQNRPSRKT